MKRKLLASMFLVMGITLMAGCAKKNDESTNTKPTETEIVAVETESVEPETETEVVENHDNMYQSELTNEWIDVSLKDQRPIAVMIDNEKQSLPHYGMNDADVVYELMNSTKNGRITRFMVIVKDWENITQLGSIRSARPTNFMLAAEYNSVFIHDGGPYYIDSYVAKAYTNNFSGGFARFSNGKSAEFTEYVTYDSYTNTKKNKTYNGLKQYFEQSNYTTTYNDYYPGEHFKFAQTQVSFDGRTDSTGAVTVALPFKHNSSTLKYNSSTGTYDYYEYGEAHNDAATGEILTFKNVILQDTTFKTLDENGYMMYNVVDSGRSGYYITDGKAIAITWSKSSESDVTHYYDAATGAEIELNTGKTYIALVPSDNFSSIAISAE